MHFGPNLHLLFNPEGVNIDPAGAVPPVPDSVEFEGSDAALAHVADKARFFKSLPGCDLMGGEAANGIAFGNDPAPAAPGSHQADINIPIWGDKEWKCSNLMQGIIPILETQNLLSVDSSA
jgi:hypothetical protein